MFFLCIVKTYISFGLALANYLLNNISLMLYEGLRSDFVGFVYVARDHSYAVKSPLDFETDS